MKDGIVTPSWSGVPGTSQRPSAAHFGTQLTGGLNMPLTALQSQTLRNLSQQAFAAFNDAQISVPSIVVTPAVPILFFGDLEAYFASPLRIVTVGLNPSLAEFPIKTPFLRFPAASGLTAVTTQADQERYAQSLSRYFYQAPYCSWFGTYADLLKGMDASFHFGSTRTALHTDLCSPVATNPTWSRLAVADRQALIGRGQALWHDLIRFVAPHVMLISVARLHLDSIKFTPTCGWQPLHTVHRKNPYIVEYRAVELDSGSSSTQVFGRAANKPFGLIGKCDKLKVGAAVRGVI
jgi:hypothetical protein